MTLLLVAFAALPALASATGGRGDRQAAEDALQRVKDLKRGLGVRTGRELTPALADLNARRADLDAAGRAQAAALLARPTDGNADPQGDGYTVPEATPVCGAHFCIHYVTTTADAPPLADGPDPGSTPDYVDQMLAVFEDEVFPCENTTAAAACDGVAAGLGWPQAPSDGTRGGDSRFDIYIKDFGDPASIFGYAAPEQSTKSSFSYMVLDDDYTQSEYGYADPLLPLRVTAAHEYNHVLQFGIDSFEDTWMFESTATWAEDKVYPAINDYLGYVDQWVLLTDQPITSDPADANNTTAREDLKIYGSAVWNHFIDHRHGQGTVLDAWQASVQVNGGPFAPASYGAAIAANGGAGFSQEFEDFSAAVAEWRTPGSDFPDLYPDLPASARPNLAVGASATSLTLNHTTAKYRNIPVPAASSTLTLTATLPAGLKGAIALVARTGNSTTAGTVTTSIQHLTNGGAASVGLPAADTYGRITAVLVNSDPTQNGFNNGKQDWNFTKDNQTFTGVRVTSQSGPAAPAATTSAASGIAADAATLNGVVNPNGQATTYWFEYGETTSYGSQIPVTPAAAGSGISGVSVSAALAGLTRGTTYHYRLVATSAGGTRTGADNTFTTLDPPIVTTDPATDVATDGATLNATVDPRGDATTYVFEFGTTTAYGNEAPLSPASAGSATGPVEVALVLTGLDPGTTIHYRVVATNADGTSVGEDRSFTTPVPAENGTPPPESPPADGGAQPPPGAAGSVVTPLTPLALTVAVAKARLASVLKRGLRVRASCTRSCRAVVQLVLPAKVAKRLRLKRTIATVLVTLAPGAPRRVTLRLSRAARRALARAKTMSAELRVTATASDGKRVVIKRRVRLRR